MADLSEVSTQHSGVQIPSLEGSGCPHLELGADGSGLQILRATVDVIQECNLRCLYCHPGRVWIKQHLAAADIDRIFAALEAHGLLEVVITGGEVTIHPELAAILAATHRFERSAVVLITNATKIDASMVDAFARSGLTRICVSLDGPDKSAHASARGHNFRRVLDGLKRLGDSGKPLTVISVAHKRNYRQLSELSMMLADARLADQHHICAPSYSGTARLHYEALKLDWDDYFVIQEAIDAIHSDLERRGVYVTFNSFWPATGQKPLHLSHTRTVTIQQLSEQVKDSLVNIRPNGDLRLNATTWGRESVGRAVIGNIHDSSPRTLCFRPCFS